MTRCLECRARWEETTTECPSCGSAKRLTAVRFVCGRCNQDYADFAVFLACVESHQMPLLPARRPKVFSREPVIYDFGVNI